MYNLHTFYISVFDLRSIEMISQKGFFYVRKLFFNWILKEENEGNGSSRTLAVTSLNVDPRRRKIRIYTVPHTMYTILNADFLLIVRSHCLLIILRDYYRERSNRRSNNNSNKQEHDQRKKTRTEQKHTHIKS